MYPREQYLKEMISKKDNGRIKIITGLRRSGKSVLLFQLYREWLLGEGMKEDQIIALVLDLLENARYRNPLELDKYVRDHMVDPKKRYYIFIDEIQFVSEIQNPYVDNEDAKITFIDVILGFMHMDNADVYVTGSNSKMLSSDIFWKSFRSILRRLSDSYNSKNKILPMNDWLKSLTCFWCEMGDENGWWCTHVHGCTIWDASFHCLFS